MKIISTSGIDINYDFSSEPPFWNGFWNDSLGRAGCDPDVSSVKLR